MLGSYMEHYGAIKHSPRLFPKQGNLLQSQFLSRKTVSDSDQWFPWVLGSLIQWKKYGHLTPLPVWVSHGVRKRHTSLAKGFRTWRWDLFTSLLSPWDRMSLSLLRGPFSNKKLSLGYRQIRTIWCQERKGKRNLAQKRQFKKEKEKGRKEQLKETKEEERTTQT